MSLWRERSNCVNAFKAIAGGPWVTAAEFLLLNGAQHTAVDVNEQTPLHIASQASSVALVGLLLKKVALPDSYIPT